MVTIQEAQKEPALFDKFIEENLRLVHMFAIKFSNVGEYEDRVQIGSIGLIKAAKTFDCSKGLQFSTYAGRLISNEILMTYRKIKKHESVLSLEEPLSIDIDGNEMTLMDSLDSGQIPENEFLDKFELNEKVKELLPKLSEKYREILAMHLDGKDQRYIGKKLGLSQSYISRMIKNIISLGSQIDIQYKTGNKIHLINLGKKERKTMEEEKFNRQIALELLKDGQSPDYIAAKFAHLYNNEPRTIKRILGKWGLLEDKPKTEPKEDKQKKSRKKGEKKQEATVTLKTEAVRGKSFRYDLGERLTISFGENQLPCEFNELSTFIAELQQVERIAAGAI